MSAPANPAVALRPKFPSAPFRTAPEFFAAYAEESAAAASTVHPVEIQRAAAILLECYDRGGAVFSCGNGGSASIANHLQCDHVKGVRVGTGLRTRVAEPEHEHRAPQRDRQRHRLRRGLRVPAAIAGAAGRRPDRDLLVGPVAQHRPRPGRGPAPGRPRDDRAHGLRRRRAGSPPRLFIHVDTRNYGVIEDAHQACMHLLAQYIRQSRMSHDAIDVNHVLGQSADTRMRVAINLLTDDPANPSGAHWFWTRVIPEMAARLETGEELHLLVSPQSRPLHQGYGPSVRYITFPWSNERRALRTLSEHLYAPVRLPIDRIDVFNTAHRAAGEPAPSLVAHFKTMHAFTAPDSATAACALYRRMNYPRTAKVADAIIINSESLRSEVTQYLDVDPDKLRLIPEAVDHDLFRPGDRAEACARVTSHGVTKPFVLFVSSLWPYKNCRRTAARVRAAVAELGDHQLVIVGLRPRRRIRRRARGAGRRVGHRRRRRLGRRRPARRDGRLLPGRGRVRVPVVQRDVRAAHPRGDGLRLPGRDVRPQRDAGDRGRCGLLADPSSPDSIADAIVEPATASSDRGAMPGSPRRGVHLGALSQLDPGGLPRGRSGAATGSDEGPGHRRSGVHRLPHVRPARRARPRRRRPRRPDARRCTATAPAVPHTVTPTSSSGDVRNRELLANLLRRVDAVYHFAAYQDYLPDFSRFTDVNVVSTALLYEIAVAEGLDLQRVVVASSQSAMGEGLYRCPVDGEQTPGHASRGGPQAAQWDIPCPLCGGPLELLRTPERISNPQNAYGMSKYGQEMVAINLGRRYGIPTVALRYSIVQGPRQSVYNAYSGACRIFCLHYLLAARRRCTRTASGPRLRQHPRRRRRQPAGARRRSRSRAGVQRGRRPRLHDARVRRGRPAPVRLRPSPAESPASTASATHATSSPTSRRCASSAGRRGARRPSPWPSTPHGSRACPASTRCSPRRTRQMRALGVVRKASA